MPAPALVVLGSINVDRFLTIAALPRPGETITGRSAAVRTGGKGANQAGAAARLGCPTSFHGRVGDDASAAQVIADLAATGCSVAGLLTAPGPTGEALILLQPGGENSIILAPGANHVWPEHVEFSQEFLRDLGRSSGLLLQCEIPQRVNLAAVAAARAAGVPVILDAGGSAEPLSDELLAGVAVLSPNESELARLTGLPTTTDAEVLEAVRTIQTRGVDLVLVKLGARGALAVPRHGRPTHQPAFAVPVVDTTGAGDCFTAAFAVGMSDGLAPASRLRFAAAAAALCVQTAGALPSMPDRGMVQDFLGKTGD
ncbi:ribokinase [Planctomycetota bacterium]|nr:ribokinase [Planctomycetota bacterium]